MIRKANLNDIPQIMEIIKEVVMEMKEYNNPQWSENYPKASKFMEDIEKNSLYVYEENNIEGFLTIAKDEGEYKNLLETSNKKAYILHRLAIKKECRNKGLAITLLNFAENLAKENNIKVLKSDTEKRNTKMNNLFQKLNFIKKGEFEYDDYPGHYIYYEKELKDRGDKNV